MMMVNNIIKLEIALNFLTSFKEILIQLLLEYPNHLCQEHPCGGHHLNFIFFFQIAQATFIGHYLSISLSFQKIKKHKKQQCLFKRPMHAHIFQPKWIISTLLNYPRKEWQEYFGGSLNSTMEPTKQTHTHSNCIVHPCQGHQTHNPKKSLYQVFLKFIIHSQQATHFKYQHGDDYSSLLIHPYIQQLAHPSIHPSTN